DTIRDAYVPGSQHTSLGTGDYGGTLRFAGSRGLLAVVQNPFLEFRRDGNAFAIHYQPDMDWRAEYGPFASDRGLLAPVRLDGRHAAVGAGAARLRHGEALEARRVRLSRTAVCGQCRVAGACTA